MIGERKLLPLTPEECVSESMMLAFSRRITDGLAQEILPQGRDSLHKTIDEVTRIQTRNQCFTSSVKALYFMHNRYPEMFDRYMVVTAKQGENDKFKHEDWFRHVYFLVRGINGVLYSASPANFSANNYPPIYDGQRTVGRKADPEYLNPLDKFFKGNSTEEIISQIHNEEGGDWPEPKLVENALGSSYQSPNFTLYQYSFVDNKNERRYEVGVISEVLEVTTDYDERLQYPDNSPIHMQNAAPAFLDLGSKIDPKTLRLKISLEDEDFAKRMLKLYRVVATNKN